MLPTPRRVALASLLALAALSGARSLRAEDPPAPAAPPSPTAPAPAKASSEPRITLIDAGAEPRAKLRYTLEKGRTERVEMRMEVSQEVTVDGQKTPMPGMPALTMALRTTVEDVSEDGSSTLLWDLTEMKVEPGEGTPPESRRAMEEIFAQMRMKLRMRMSSRGFVTSSTLELPDDVTGPARAALEQMAAQMKESMADSATLLPEEPVGAGASWKIELAKKTPQGVEVKASTVSTLSAAAEGKANIDGKVAMEAPEQDVALPNMPAAKPAHLHSMTGEGTARIGFDPKRVVSETEMHLVVDMKMTLDQGGAGPTTMVIRQTMDVAIRAQK